MPSPSAAEMAALDPDGEFRQRLADDRNRLEIGEPAEVVLIVHRLAGAAGTFGYAQLGELAIALDDELAEGRPLPSDAIDRLLAALDRALEKSA